MMLPAVLLTVLVACTDGHGTSNRGCHDAAIFSSPTMCHWILESFKDQSGVFAPFWDNGWQSWTVRCVEKAFTQPFLGNAP